MIRFYFYHHCFHIQYNCYSKNSLLLLLVYKNNNLLKKGRNISNYSIFNFFIIIIFWIKTFQMLFIMFSSNSLLFLVSLGSFLSHTHFFRCVSVKNTSSLTTLFLNPPATFLIGSGT